MDPHDRLKNAFRDEIPQSGLGKRQIRAMRTRKRALSPVRILLNLMLVPVVTVVMTASIFMQTSPYGDTDALRHLIALGGCDAAIKVQIAPAVLGQPGYHKRNDPDGDGVACDEGIDIAYAAPAMPQDPATPMVERGNIVGPKFVKP
jgi:hypothetical protein